MVRILLYTAVLAITSFLVPETHAQMPGMRRPLDTMVVNGDSRYDVTYVKLDLQIGPDTEYVAGSALIRSIATGQNFTDVIVLSLRPQLGVDSILDQNGDTLQFLRDADRLVVFLRTRALTGSLFDVTIFYRGYSTEPDRNGIIHTTQYADGSGDPIIWSHSEPYGAKAWWPCKDNPNDKIDSVDLWFTCDTTYKVASNGLLMNVTPMPEGKHRFEWKHRYPIAHYLVAFTCTRYSVFSQWWKYSATDSLEILNYVYPDKVEEWKRALAVVPDILSTFTEWFGEYPFLKERYGHAQWRGGGMENQTMTFLTSYDTAVIAHEAAHQWFGNAITMDRWNDLWLNEGFASYWDKQYMAKLFGPSRLDQLFANSEQFITSDVGGSVVVPDSLLPDVRRLFNPRLTYEKGSWILHMLRYKIGDSLFMQGIRSYINGPLRYGTANTLMFVQTMEQVAKQPLGDWLGPWLFMEGYPTYQFYPQTIGVFGIYRSVLRLEQTPSKSPVFYPMPIQLKVEGDGWDSIITVNHTFSGQTWQFDFQKEPRRWIFDPFNRILDGKVDQVLSVRPAPADSLAAIFPNPVQKGEAVTLQLGKGVVLRGAELFDIAGKLVWQEMESADTLATIPTDGMASGHYTVKLYVLAPSRSLQEVLLKLVVQ